MRNKICFIFLVPLMFLGCNFFFTDSEAPLNLNDAYAPIAEYYLDTSVSGEVTVQWRWGNLSGAYGIESAVVSYSAGAPAYNRYGGDYQTVPSSSASEATFILDTEHTEHWFFIHYRLNNSRWYNPYVLLYENP